LLYRCTVPGLHQVHPSLVALKEPTRLSQYHIDAVDPTVRNSSQAIELELVGPNRRVLDVGCATGFFGKALAAQGCAVTGVEFEPQAAAEARAHLDEVVEADLNVTALADIFADREFDAIVFGDVLEHLMDPDAVLRSAVQLLAAGGAIVMSIPNVAHGSLRLALLQGRWDYLETGLLDRTHLRFFTHESVVAMVVGAGLDITDLRGTILDPLGCEVEIDDESLPGTIVDWVRGQPDALTYQFVLRAEVARAHGAPVPDLLPAVELPPAEDAHSARAALEARDAAEVAERRVLIEELTDARRRILTLRDHAIGAEVTVGTARAEVEAAKSEVHNALTELVAVKQSRTWRAGKLVLAPVGAVRRILRSR
jgi:2-polyprenyl-3-methyl-5-hydroxy-6-metoxy-1,4-benzoquinol methylase